MATLVPAIDNGRPVAYDAKTGVQIYRAGQAFNAGFLDSIVKSYTNIIYHPWACFALILSFAVLLSAVDGVDGPLEILRDYLAKIAGDEKELWYVRQLAKLVMAACLTLIKIRDKFFISLLMWVPYMVKPSSRHFYISVVATFVVVLMKNVSLLNILLVSQMYYLVVMMRSPVHKFIIAGIILFLICSDWVPLNSLNKMLNATAETVDKMSKPINVRGRP